MEQTKKTWVDYYKKFGIYIFLAVVFVFLQFLRRTFCHRIMS